MRIALDDTLYLLDGYAHTMPIVCDWRMRLGLFIMRIGRAICGDPARGRG